MYCEYVFGRFKTSNYNNYNKKAISIAIKYSSTRLTVGESGKSDTSILSYQLQQNALIPLLANVIALNIGFNYCKNVWADYTMNGEKSKVPQEMVVLLW